MRETQFSLYHSDLLEISICMSVEFVGLPEDILMKTLKLLERQQKAEIIAIGDGSGVKFFD